MLNSKKPDRKPPKKNKIEFQAWKKRKLNSGEAKDAWEENKRLYRELQAYQAERESIIE